MDDEATRALLERERRAALTRIDLLRADFDGIVAASSDANVDDEHDPEGSTIAFERAQISALAAQAKAYLADVERALAKLDDGTYRICDVCGSAIPAERLAARPAALRCVACAART
jgi:DnaK suppressor protein